MTILRTEIEALLIETFHPKVANFDLTEEILQMEIQKFGLSGCKVLGNVN